MRTGFLSTAIVCVVLAVAPLVAYRGVLFSDFVDYDDKQYVYQNKDVLNGLSGAGFQYAWTTFDCGNWHPLTWLSLQLDASLWGRKPIGFHATNLILHMINGVLVFVVLNRLTSAFLCSACVAAFFALHPLHVESVAWVAERKDVLSTLFLLLTILAYLRYARRGSLLSYLLVLALFALGLLAKPMLVTLPVLLLLVDLWPMNRAGLFLPSDSEEARYLHRSVRWLMIEKIPLLCFAFADGLMTMKAQNVEHVTLRDVELPTRIANAFHAYVWYLQKTFVPTNLIVFYPHPERDLASGSVVIGAVVMTGISLWVVWRGRQDGHLLFGWIWFVVSLLPVIGLIQVGGQAYADRYSYIPHIGLFTAIVWEIDSRLGKRKWIRISTTVMAIAAIVACGLLTWNQVGYWKNSATLWNHAYAVNPGSYVAHDHLAELFYTQGKFDQAAGYFERTLQHKRMQQNADAYCAWGWCLVELNRPAEAEEKYRMALKIDRKHKNAAQLLVDLLQKQGRSGEAAEIGTPRTSSPANFELQHAKQNPDSEASQMTLGYEMAGRGDVAAAIVHFEKAVRLAPNSAEAFGTLAFAQTQLQRFKDAKANFLRAVELNPKVADTHFNLGQILENEKDFDGARKHYAEAVRLNPADAEAKVRLERLPKP